MNDLILRKLNFEVNKELTENILPFWMTKMPDPINGGFYGRIDGNNNLEADAPKGGILNARILWTFSSAYNALKDSSYLKMAFVAREYILHYFFDNEYGGTYWSLSADGKPLDTKKQVYSQAFFIYALCEYYLATGDEVCKTKAIELFQLIEKYSFDKELNGYFEAYSREWTLLDDLRLSEKDANEKKTMNTHLHVLEAYTNLYRIWENETLASQLKNLIIIFLDNIIDNSTWHLNLFFNENWECKSAITSYGHDIEASWLLYEAAMVLGDDQLIHRVSEVCIKIATVTLEGLQGDGSLINEKDNASGHVDMDRHWWPQAEAVVGFFNAWELTNDESFVEKSMKCFSFIKQNLVDARDGEWYWSLKSDGTINTTDDKAGFWKCPYHNGRMCLEIRKRTESSI